MQWNPLWTQVWHYYPDGRRTGIDPDRHLMHQFGNTPCIDVGVYAYWTAEGVDVLRFAFRRPASDGAIGLVALVRTLDAVKIPFSSKEHGEQWATPEDAAEGVWHRVHSKEDADAKVAELLAMAYGPA